MIAFAEPDTMVGNTATHENTLIPPANAESAMIVQYTDSSEKLSWPLDHKRPIMIGRSTDCDLILAMRDISRRHAQVYWDGQDYFLEDLGSRNGTKVNNVPCQAPMRLHNGDEVKFGDALIFYFVDDESTELLPCNEENLGLTIDFANRTLVINGQPLPKPLSPPQYRMANLLYNAEEQIVTRQEIVEAVWADEAYHGVSEQAIDAVARRIRLQIAKVAPGVDYLQTIRGHGFRLMRNPQ